MNALTNLLGDNVISALGWSLFNVLWQGFLVAVVLGIFLYSFRKKSAQSRYIVSIASLLLIVGLSIFNFADKYESETVKTNSAENTVQFETKSENRILNIRNYTVDFSFNELVSRLKSNLNTIDKYFPLVINIWLIGMFVFILKFVFSYLYTNRFKKLKTNSLSQKWMNNFKVLEQKLQLKKKINYIESAIIKVPFVLGYLKPFVVIPTELLTGMPSNQIEAIVAHELAHIRRNDYIINVLQTIIETVFFFHPAVWYISSQIRKERENCCDDIALTACEGSIVYAKALVSVQELSLGRQYAAVAFSGKKKHLLNRIKRMIMKPKIKSNFTDKMIASLVIVSAILALSFTYNAETTNFDEMINLRNETKSEVVKSKPTEKEVVINKEVIEESVFMDTVKVNNGNHKIIDIDDNTVTKTIKKNGKKSEMKFTLKNGDVTELFVDGKEIPRENYSTYQADIDETIEDLQEAKKDIRQAMKDIEEMDIEAMQLEIQESMKDFHIDIEAMQVEVAEAMENVKEVNMEEIMENIEKQMKHLEDMDFDFDFKMEDVHVDIDLEKIHEELEEAHKQMSENLDMEAIQKQLREAQEELQNINEEKIKLQMKEGLENIEAINKEEIQKELEEQLDKLENLELEEK
jgi:beta-lactamase regulating signal transducer with metallopeptidase domain